MDDQTRTVIQPPQHDCKYCGAPSWIDPSDQTPPQDYCQEIDHGSADDRQMAEFEGDPHA